MKLQSPRVSYTKLTTLDLVSTPLEVNPGAFAESENFEIGINGGVNTVKGYEAFDGQSAPSDAVYYGINCDITGTIAVDDTITGSVSGETAVVVGFSDDYVYYAYESGDFSIGEYLNVGGSPQAEVLATKITGGASTQKNNAIYKSRAADLYRADIDAVPGEGDVLGVFSLLGEDYAIRKGISEIYAYFYKATSSGWTLIDYPYELYFTSGGTYEVQEQDVITGGISGATATIQKVILTSGSWAGGDAAGRFIINTVTGTFQAENLSVPGQPNCATSSGAQELDRMIANGCYEIVCYNFEHGCHVYGVNGSDYGWEFDGETYIRIYTTMTTDTPSHVAVHKNHLFFSFGLELQHSSIGQPYSWSPVTGASAIAIGDEITALKVEPGVSGDSALTVYSRNSSHVLYGTSSSDWNLVQYRDEIGAYEATVQQLGVTLFMDDRGITNLQTTQQYGNFAHSSISKLVQPFIVSRKSNVISSCICREKNQYRLFFDDNYALYVTMDGNKVIGMMPVKLDHKVCCISSVEEADGTEKILFGSDDGYVYQMEKGTSFDGDDILFYFRTQYNSLGNALLKKSYKTIALDAYGEGYGEANFTYELGYSDGTVAQPAYTQENEYNYTQYAWDAPGLTWDTIYWDTTGVSNTIFRADGTAANICIIIQGSGNYFDPISFSGYTLRYLPRRLIR